MENKRAMLRLPPKTNKLKAINIAKVAINFFQVVKLGRNPKDCEEIVMGGKPLA